MPYLLRSKSRPFVYVKAYMFIKTDSLNILLIHIDFSYLQIIDGISN